MGRTSIGGTNLKEIAAAAQELAGYKQAQVFRVSSSTAASSCTAIGSSHADLDFPSFAASAGIETVQLKAQFQRFMASSFHSDYFVQIPVAVDVCLRKRCPWHRHGLHLAASVH